jgi:hypothetical protein
MDAFFGPAFLLGSAAALTYFGPRLFARLVAGLIAIWLHWVRE